MYEIFNGLSSGEQKRIDFLHVPPRNFVWRPVFHIAILVSGLIAGAKVDDVGIKLLVAILSASQFLTLYSYLHQASHGALSTNRTANELCGRLIGMFLGVSFKGYRLCHMMHHKFLRQERDLQDVIHDGKGNPVLTAVLLILAAIIGAFVFIYIRIPIFGTKLSKSIRVPAETLISWGLWAIVVLISPPYLATQLAITVSIAIVWGSMVDITYHQGLSLNGDLSSSRSLNSHWFGGFILNGEHRHAEHHAFPRIPGCHLEELSEIISPLLKRQGAIYEGGYIAAFLSGLAGSPFFLPPRKGR